MLKLVIAFRAAKNHLSMRKKSGKNFPQSLMRTCDNKAVASCGLSFVSQDMGCRGLKSSMKRHRFHHA